MTDPTKLVKPVFKPNLPPLTLPELIKVNAVNPSHRKQILREMAATGQTPIQVIDRLGLRNMCDYFDTREAIPYLEHMYPKNLAEYLVNNNLHHTLVSYVLRYAKGKAIPALVSEVLADWRVATLAAADAERLVKLQAPQDNLEE